jgi:cytidine deaminase
MKGPEDLLEAARQVRARAHCPYSRYAVGAALRSRDGKIYTGANVENACYPLGLCAERSAVVSAVSAGERHFEEILVITRDGGSPCGACRQVLREFGEDLRIWIASEAGLLREHRLRDLLPDSFGPDNVLT